MNFLANMFCMLGSAKAYKVLSGKKINFFISGLDEQLKTIDE
jgi:hypothetical protein